MYLYVCTVYIKRKKDNKKLRIAIYDEAKKIFLLF